MPKIHSVKPLTNKPHLNLYELDAENRKGKHFPYYVASRALKEEDLKLKTKENHADGVIIYSLYGEKKDKVILVKQYRYAIDDYIYEFPAGLVERGEDFKEAAIREMKEETGLLFTPVPVSEGYEKPYFTTIGMTDESCGTVYGYASGEISADGQEDTEDIQVIIADKEEVKRILKEEKVAIMCAYMLMHFIHDEEPFAFLR